MPSSRRTLLAALGVGVAGVGGVGYWQRRRIRRRDDLAAIDDALEEPTPAVETGAVVTDDHLEATYERAVETIEDVDSRIDEELPWDADVSEWRPAALEDAPRDERHNALGHLASLAGEARSVLAHHRFEDRRRDWDDLEQRLTEEREALETVHVEYRAPSMSEAIDQYAAVDSRHRSAAIRLDRAQRRLDGDQADYALASQWIERARFHRADAEWFTRAIDGEDYTDRLESTLERTVDAADEALEDLAGLEVDHPDAERNYVADAVRTHRLFDGIRENVESRRGDPGPYLAAGVRFAATQYTYARALERPAFTETPERRAWDDVAPPVDARDLPERKREAIEAIENATAAYGDDPFGRRLLAESIDRVDSADRSLGSARDGVTDRSRSEWREQLTLGYMRYLEGAAFAEAIPETMALVLE